MCEQLEVERASADTYVITQNNKVVTALYCEEFNNKRKDICGTNDPTLIWPKAEVFKQDKQTR